jgi:hypothetical protein
LVGGCRRFYRFDSKRFSHGLSAGFFPKTEAPISLMNSAGGKAIFTASDPAGNISRRLGFFSVRGTRRVGDWRLVVFLLKKWSLLNTSRMLLKGPLLVVLVRA